MTITLSGLSIVLGLLVVLPQVYGLMNPEAYGGMARKFPRSLSWGIPLMLLATAWFLYYLSQESIADFASYKNFLFAGFAAVGIGSCIFVQDFLAVRGLAVVCLLLGKLLVDTGRPHLAQTHWVLVIQVWAYVLVVLGMWLTVSPWRLRDWIDWVARSRQRTQIVCGLRLVFGLLLVALGFTAFRP